MSPRKGVSGAHTPLLRLRASCGCSVPPPGHTAVPGKLSSCSQLQLCVLAMEKMHPNPDTPAS